MESFFGYVKNVTDALILFEAARQELVPLLTSRLSETGRQQIRPGSIFIWEIKQDGMKRWTDGHSWSPSRYHNHFFYYHEVDENSETSPDATKTERYKINGLLKRTTSISTVDGRKFQLVNYVFNDSKYNLNLPTLEAWPGLGFVQIPFNYYYRPTTTQPKNEVPDMNLTFMLMPETNIYMSGRGGGSGAQPIVADPFYNPNFAN